MVKSILLGESLPNFIGAYQRASFSAQKLLFEYALNTWFNTNFKQPVAGQSDIYITRNNVTNSQFFFGQQSNVSYFSPTTIRDLDSPVISSYFSKQNPNVAQYNFTINIPLTVYNNLSPNSSLRLGIVRNFADKLCPAGATYNVITY